MARRITRSSLIAVLIVGFVLLAIIIGIVSITGKPDEKNATEYSKNNKYWDTVYADIVSISPTATVSQIGRQNYNGFICSCETVSGETIDVYVSEYDYGKYIKKKGPNSWDSWSYSIPNDLEFDTPLHIIGRVVKYKDVVNGSKKEDLIFRLDKSDRPTE